MTLFVIKQILILVSRKVYHRINTENGKKKAFREEECLSLCGNKGQQAKKKKVSGCVQSSYKMWKVLFFLAAS